MLKNIKSVGENVFTKRLRCVRKINKIISSLLKIDIVSFDRVSTARSRKWSPREPARLGQSDAPIHEQRGLETRAVGRKLVNGSSQPEVMLLAKWHLSIAVVNANTSASAEGEGKPPEGNKGSPNELGKTKYHPRK